MISYRPTPELTAGRTGFKAAIGAMALAAVLGTTAFAPIGAESDPQAEEAPAVVGAAAIGAIPAEQALLRRDGSLDQGAAAGPLQA
ncbi:hypothetical protein [Arthrobacter sedimenti]|uniref:hypothetical protein n=1 Tax=Arthrobacter sedimenti TaxID=2694931 RepID=UPI000B34D935|nr:hypothetical protein [Arthrobacter sedimenti]OUM41871.1 hypothetical protein B8W73_09595 [Arthrobacter agilis]